MTEHQKIDDKTGLVAAAATEKPRQLQSMPTPIITILANTTSTTTLPVNDHARTHNLRAHLKEKPWSAMAFVILLDI